MIRLEAKNPRFTGVRAGVRFRDGTAQVAVLTGEQRQAMRKFGITIVEAPPPAPNALGELTVRELRRLADSRGVRLPKNPRKADIVTLLS